MWEYMSKYYVRLKIECGLLFFFSSSQGAFVYVFCRKPLGDRGTADKTFIKSYDFCTKISQKRFLPSSNERKDG